jgi:hypothetical protein
MREPVNTLLDGWPDTTVITGKKKQFLGYSLSCRYFSPLGRKILKPLSVMAWLIAVAVGIGVAGDVPEDEALASFLTIALITGGVGQWLLGAVLRSRLQMEIRPQVIRVRRRSSWREFDTRASEFALMQHDKAIAEDLKEHERLRRIQKGENVELPGQFYRSSASVALIVHGQRVDIAHIYDSKVGPQGPRKAADLFRRLAACLQDVREREFGQQLGGRSVFMAR